MNRRFLTLGLLCVLVSACGASMGVGSGGVDNLASTRVKTNSSSAVNEAVIEVFQGQGFKVLSQGARSVTFSKPGGRSADLAWSTLNNPNPVMIRPTVRWQSAGTAEMAVTCQVEITQQSTVFGEDTRQPFLMGKAAYNGMLSDVKRRVEKGR